MEHGKRQAVLREVAALVPPERDRIVLVGIDGVDGSGKTWFAEELADALRDDGRAADVVHLDDFHHLRARRYRLGRDSPEGFFLDSYDYAALDRLVLAPLRAGAGHYTPRWTDLDRDEVVDEAPRTAARGSVVLVEGIFLHRDELALRFDLTVLLDVPFSASVARMAARDGSTPDPEDPSQRRYVEGQRRYFARCDPRTRASVVIDNTDLRAPYLVG